MNDHAVLNKFHFHFVKPLKYSRYVSRLAKYLIKIDTYICVYVELVALYQCGCISTCHTCCHANARVEFTSWFLIASKY